MKDDGTGLRMQRQTAVRILAAGFGLLIVAILFVITLSAALPATAVAVLIVALVVVATLGTGIALLRLHHARIVVDAEAVTLQGLFRRRRVLYTEIGEVLWIERLLGSPASSGARLILLGHPARPLLRLGEGPWSSTELALLAEALGRPVTRFRAIRAVDLRRSYPDALGWTATHPSLFAGIVLVLSVAVVLGIAGVLTAVYPGS